MSLFTKKVAFRSHYHNMRFLLKANMSNDVFSSLESARATVKQGKIQGNLESLSNGNKFASFKGIPYAKPPLGKLRFKSPQPPDSWEGVRDATQHGAPCPQLDMFSRKMIEGSEDCLTLNVYTANFKGPPAPVMVWIHGGFLRSGSGNSDLYGPNFLLEEGVVIVTFNYRLETLGFLTTESKEVPGNAGVKDQVAALRWVQENISNLGGDPENVTIFGESAGAVCATYHMCSPMAQGLFHKVIAQSGCILNEMANQFNSKDCAFRLANYLGKKTDNVDELVEFLQSVPTSNLINVTPKIMKSDEKVRGLPVLFSPLVETNCFEEEVFLPKPAPELLKEGNYAKVPVLVGYNDSDGMISLIDILKKADQINSNFDRRVPKRISDVVSKDILQELGLRIKKFYFGDKKLSDDTANEIVKMETDYNFSIDIINYAKILSEKSKAPVFLNRFSIDSNINLMKNNFAGLRKYKGAGHGDDISFLFKTALVPQETSESFKDIRRMVRMWTNFAKFGNPTPASDDLISVNWKPVKKDELNFLDIKSDLEPGVNPDEDRYNFWMEIFQTNYAPQQC